MDVADGWEYAQPVILNSHKLPNVTAPNPLQTATSPSQPVGLVRPSLMISSPWLGLLAPGLGLAPLFLAFLGLRFGLVRPNDAPQGSSI